MVLTNRENENPLQSSEMADQINESGESETNTVVKSEGMNESSDKMEAKKEMKNKKENSKDQPKGSMDAHKFQTPFCLFFTFYSYFCFFCVVFFLCVTNCNKKSKQ